MIGLTDKEREELRTAVEDFKRAVLERFEPILKPVVEWLSKLLTKEEK